MRNMFLGVFGDFIDKILNILYIAVIVICTIICISLICKYKGTRTIFFYIVSVALIFSAVYCGINFFKEINQEGYITGSLSLKNSTIQSEFYYSTDSIVFYKDSDDKYVYEKSFIGVHDYDGSKNDYVVKLKDYELINAELSAGAVYCTNSLDYLNTSGETTKSVSFDLLLQFMSDKTVLKITTDTESEAEYLQKYFKDFGFGLSVNLMEE